MRIHEVVDVPNWVVGAFLPHAIFEIREAHMATTRSDPVQDQPSGGLRRELKFWETIALSIGIMAPTAAMALNGTAPAGLIGRAVPLAFIFATVGVLLVAYAFIRLSRYFSHAGIGVRLLGGDARPASRFLCRVGVARDICVLLRGVDRRGRDLRDRVLQEANIIPGIDYVWIALVAAALIAVLAYGDIRTATRSLLGLEGISVTLIVILMIVIVVKLIAGTAPGNQSITADAFKLPPGTTFSVVASASVFGFLSFGGFEGAASLGEESDNPRSEIPRAIRNAVLGCGIFYILCITVQTWGFGTDAAGVKAFSTSGAPLGDLARSYVGPGMSEAIDLGAMISAFASGLAATAAGARILFALSRDTVVGSALGRTSTRTGAPAGALTVVLGSGWP